MRDVKLGVHALILVVGKKHAVQSFSEMDRRRESFKRWLVVCALADFQMAKKKEEKKTDLQLSKKNQTNKKTFKPKV